MDRTPPLAIAVLAAAVSACGATPRRAVVDPTAARLIRSLELPPTERSIAAFTALRGRSSCAARWGRLRYLIDLHDLTLAFSGESDEVDEEQRRAARRADALLRSQLGVGELDEAKALTSALLKRVAAFRAASCPLAAVALQARTLLLADAAPRARHADALRAAIMMKKVLLSRSELAPNALFRLVSWCSRAFRAAAREEPRQQQLVLNRCLYPLFEADPSPYFHPDPARRPPDPPWTVLRDASRRERARLASTRFAGLARLQQRADDAFLRRTGADLPAAVDFERLRLPASEQGMPLDRTPVATIARGGFLVDSRSVISGDEAELTRVLRRRLAGDDRASIVIVARPRATLHALFELGRAARRAGVTGFLLGVRRKVADRVPPGDVQATVAHNKRAIWRLEGIPISIRLLTRRTGEPSRDRPRQLGFDPRAARARLALHIDGAKLQLASRDGSLPAVRTIRELLRSLGGYVRRAYTDETSLIIVPRRTTSYARLIEIVQAVRFCGRRPLFPGLALAAPYSIKIPSRDGAQLISALARARVTTAPAIASAALRRLQLCYRAALREAAAKGAAVVSGTLVFEPGPRGRRLAGGSLKENQSLGICSGGALAEVRRARGITIRFSLPR